jgi:penicillin-binding protein 2
VVDKAGSRLRVLALLVAVMMIALSTRLWFLQVMAAERFRPLAVDNSVRLVYTDPLRGQIFDADGHPLVLNRGTLEVRITPDQLGDEAEAVVVRVAELTGVDVAEIVAELQDPKYVPSQAIPVAEFVSKKVRFYVAEHPEQFPGVEVVETAVRTYPRGRLGAHLLGWTGLISAEQYNGEGRWEGQSWRDQGYGLNDVVGQWGLELVYERFLRGKRGKQFFNVNADGETIRALGETPPTSGSDLVLTLSARVQREAEQALLEGMERARAYHDEDGYLLKANAGTVVVLDANTGGVVAMVSTPSFDPRWYARGLTGPQTLYLTKNPNGPANNRATQLTYSPGSAFKPITALAAVKEGFASLSGSYPCTTQYQHPGDESGTVFTNWTPSDTYMSIATALRVSCDTVFYRFGSDFYFRWTQNPLGDNSDVLERDLHEWGFEAPTGIDLPAEAQGLVPDPAWASQSEQRKILPYGWVPGGDILTMIGSTYVQVTPLQLAQAYAAIANGGHLCRPHLVDRIVAPDGSVVRQIDGRCGRTIPYSAAELSYIRAALRSVITGGTAHCAFAGFPASQIAVAGKTGTAERPPAQDTSWFAAMVGPNPDKPDYVVVTMVEQGGFGGQTAAPITRRVIAALYPELADDAPPSCTLEDR